MFFKRKFSQPLKFYISSKIHVCGSYTQQSSYNDAYYKTEVPSGASNHIPVNLYLISIQGIPLKCYIVKRYASIPEVTGSYHLYYCKITNKTIITFQNTYKCNICRCVYHAYISISYNTGKSALPDIIHMMPMGAAPRGECAYIRKSMSV